MRVALGALAALAGAGAVAGLVYLPVWLQRHDPPPPSVSTPPSEVVLADVPDATLVGRHRGRKVWQIHAGRVLAAADGQTTTFVDVDRGTLYHEGAPAARVAAAKAVYTEGKGLLRVTDGRLEAGGLALRAPSLEWSAVAQSVRAPQVTVTWDGGVATSDALEADTRLKTVRGRNARMAARLEGEMIEQVARRIGAAGGASLALFLAAAPAPAAEAAPVRYREVRVQGDTWRYDQATKTHVYAGNILATHGDTTLRADRIAYNEGANTATVTGNIRVDNPRNTITGDSASVDFNRRAIVLRGKDGVRLLARPKPGAPAGDASKERLKDPVTLDCRSITYNYRTRNADAEGPVKVTRKEQVVTGERASYAAAEDVITLTGNVRGRDEKNQTFEAPTVRVALAEGAGWMEAPNVRATFFVKEDDEPDTAAPGG